VRRAVLLVAAVAALTAGVVLLAARPGGPPAVVVADDGGREVARVPLPGDGRFELRYVHSVYKVEAAERFTADPDGGGFRLVAVASPSEAVLDYYDVQGTRTAEGGGLRLDLAAPQRFERLPLVATTTGRRTLVAGTATVPLSHGDGPASLVLTVER
jgi:hypothetical protein